MSRIVQFADYNPIPENIQACLDSVKTKKPMDMKLKVYKKLPAGIQEPPEISCGANRADLFRFSHLAKNPDVIWLDADIEVIDFYQPPKTDKPCFGASPRGNADGHPVDVHIIYGNGCRKFFEDLWALHEAWLADLAKGKRSIFSGHVWRHINRYPGSYYIIPAGHFRHLNVRSWVK